MTDMIETINPATGLVIQRYPLWSQAVVDQTVQDVAKAQENWARTALSDRATQLRQIAALLDKNKLQYARLITTEMGKPIVAARAEIEKCQWVCEYYATMAATYLAPQPVETNFMKSYVSYEPLGVLFAIMPWNFPFWQVFRFAAPNLMAGNAVILKHAPIVTGCALAIEQLCRDAGLPSNLFRAALIDHPLSDHLMKHDLVRGVTLTGSAHAGKSVGSQAGSALKKVVLELGGNDPYLVLADADINLAAENIVKSRLNNSGQVCIAAKRVIADVAIYAELKKCILDKINQYRMGDPLDESTQMGPLARKDLRDTLHTQVLDSIARGATLICGAKIPEKEGFYYPPTVLDNVKPGMPAFDDELFGPVISLISACDEEEMIALANQSPYGLSAAIFTKNLEKGEKIARERIQVGTCCVNQFVSSDPRLPFGGIKSSGYGRELGAMGMHEFVNIKTICVAK